MAPRKDSTRYRDFDAADDEAHDVRTEFKLGGETFALDGPLPFWPLMRLSKLADADDLKAVEAFYDFVMSIVPEEDHERLDQALARSKMSQSRFQELVAWLMEEETGVPSPPPSDSEQSRSPSGRRSRAASGSRAKTSGT